MLTIVVLRSMCKYTITHHSGSLYHRMPPHPPATQRCFKVGQPTVHYNTAQHPTCPLCFFTLSGEGTFGGPFAHLEYACVCTYLCIYAASRILSDTFTQSYKCTDPAWSLSRLSFSPKGEQLVTLNSAFFPPTLRISC